MDFSSFYKTDYPYAFVPLKDVIIVKRMCYSSYFLSNKMSKPIFILINKFVRVTGVSRINMNK